MAKRMGRIVRKSAAVLSLVGLVASVASAAAAPSSQRWTTYNDAAANLVFDYPAAVFSEQRSDPTEALKPRTGERVDRAGRTFFSADGKATLQIGTFPNLDKLSVDDLRKRALNASYADAKVEYKRTAETWYVLSGTRGDETFYERVHFSCNGRRLDLFALTYPTEAEDLYNEIVEEMARRVRPILARVKCGGE